MITTILFDFDGVITNTEPQYDIFFNQMAEDYNLGIRNFASLIKGVPLQEIMEKYFKDRSVPEKEQILARTVQFESQMDFPLIPGIMDFIHYLEKSYYKKAIVTSSSQEKMQVAIEKLQFGDLFPVIITANQITKGKPDPMCYLLAARKLQAAPSQCLVFEDSLAGLSAANNAGMKVVALSTTLTPDILKQYTQSIIPDFTDLSGLIHLLSNC